MTCCETINRIWFLTMFFCMDMDMLISFLPTGLPRHRLTLVDYQVTILWEADLFGISGNETKHGNVFITHPLVAVSLNYYKLLTPTLITSSSSKKVFSSAPCFVPAACVLRTLSVKEGLLVKRIV